MVELGLLVLLGAVMFVPVVLYQTLSEQHERAFFVPRRVELPGGPYREGSTEELLPAQLSPWARGAVAFSFLFSVLGLLLTMPMMIGVLSQWAGAWLVGLPGLALAMAASAAGIRVMRQGPGASTMSALVGLGQLAFGLWVLAVVETVSSAQDGPASGLIEELVTGALSWAGGQPRNGGWTLPFSVRGGLGLLPVLYATASLVHGGLLLASSRSQLRVGPLKTSARAGCDFKTERRRLKNNRKFGT